MPTAATTLAAHTDAAAAAPSSSSKKLRVLCVHGYRTNVQVMQDQTRALREVLGPHAEFVYLNGPFEAEGESDPTIEARYGDTVPFYEWWRLQQPDGDVADFSQPETTARMSETIAGGNLWYMRYGRLDETLEYMDAQLRQHGPFDVAVGFSQGSVLLTVLAMWYLEHQNMRWWKLAVCVCGIRVGATNVRELFETPDGKAILVPVPSVHIIGKLDPLCEQSHLLAEMYDAHPVGSPTARVVLEHDEGHKFPSLKHHRAFYDELVGVIRQHCGDFDSGASVSSRL